MHAQPGRALPLRPGSTLWPSPGLHAAWRAAPQACTPAAGPAAVPQHRHGQSLGKQRGEQCCQFPYQQQGTAISGAEEQAKPSPGWEDGKGGAGFTSGELTGRI